MTRGISAAALLVAAGCGGSVASSATDAGTSSAGAEAPPPLPPPTPSPLPPPPASGLPPPPPGEAWQIGGFTTDTTLLVNVGQRSTATDGAGRYKILVPRKAPLTTVISGSGYWTMLEQEWTIDRDVASRPTLNVLSNERAQTLASVVLRDPTKGVVLVKIFAEPPCTTIAGATVTLDPPGSAKVVYLDSKNVPDFDLASAVAETSSASLSAVFYDVDADVPFTITASSASCGMRPFPQDHAGVQLTGNATARAGEAYTFFRVMIGAK